MRKLSILSMLLLALNLQAIDYKDLPADRFVPAWKEILPGLPGTWDSINVANLGIVPGINVGKMFQDIIDLHTGKVLYYFPEGDYSFEKAIEIFYTRIANDNIIIKGAGPDKTRFLFDCDLNYFEGLIHIENKAAFGDRNNASALTKAPKAGDTQIEVSTNLKKYIPGRIICIKQDNPPALIYPDADVNEAWYIKWKNGEAEWGDESYGQMCKVVSIKGNIVTLDKPLGLDYDMAFNPRVSIYDSYCENIGIENIYIEHVIDDSRHVPDGKNDVFGIAIRFAENVYVKNVHSVNTARGHIIAEYSYNISITGNKFEYARNYGTGGAGYGICVQNRTSDVYIANNEFKHLRHAVVLKEGASHCVIAYNWSHDWAILDPAVGIFAEADMSIHGFYSHNNLFEGNVCNNIWYADYWGPTGPRTVAYRNKFYGIDTLDGVRVDDHSHLSSVIANIAPGLAVVTQAASSQNVMIEGNVLQGQAEWHTLSANSALPPSLYLPDGTKPFFWKDEYEYPAFGPEIAHSMSNSIPAIKSDVVSQTIPLKHGWNLVSLYVHPTATSISSVFPNASIVKTADLFYDASQPAFLHSLQTIQSYEGYLVYNSVDEVCQIQGEIQNLTPRELQQGWNLVGLHSSTALPLSTYPNAQMIKDFDGFYQPGNGMSGLAELEAGKAYFILK